ncbi:MAG: hypothetical protein HQ536_04145 [Parcubacteria group bacterium]|nr:hypothetical protein [Parcubacteria group bacterium]
MWPFKKNDEVEESIEDAPKAILAISIRNVWLITLVIFLAMLLGGFFSYLGNSEIVDIRPFMVSLAIIPFFSFLLTLLSKRMMR